MAERFVSRRRVVPLTSLALVAALAACSSNNNPPPLPQFSPGPGGPAATPTAVPATPSASPVPTPTPTLVPTPIPSAQSVSTSQRPFNNGDTYAFGGTLTKTLTFNPFLTPPPLPQPLPSAATNTLVQAVTQNVAVTYPATFNGTANAYDFRSAETDAGPLATTGSTTDTYYQLAAGPSATQVFLLGSSATTTGGSTYTTTFPASSQLVDVLPETAGPISTTSGTMVLTETDADGQTTQRTTNPDGTYTENATYPDGTSAHAVQNADGTASDSLPIRGIGPPIAPTNTTVTIGAPATDPNIGPYIPITIVYAAGVGGATPVTVNRQAAVWYPGGNPAPLLTRSLTNAGTAALPAGCTVPASATTGHAIDEIVEADQRVDAVFGDLETLSIATYSIAGYGPACIVSTDNVNHYYDYTGQSPTLIRTTGTLLGTSTIAQTLSLTSAKVVGPNARDRRLLGGGASATPSLAIAQAAVAHFRETVERARLTRHAAWFRRVHTNGGR